MKSLDELADIRNKTLKTVDVRNMEKPKRVVVGTSTAGIAAGARSVLQAIVDQVASRELLDVAIAQSGEALDGAEQPVVRVFLPGRDTITYVGVKPEMAERIVVDTVVDGKLADGIATV